MYVFARYAWNPYSPSQISYGGGRHSQKMYASNLEPSASPFSGCSQIGGDIPGNWSSSKRWKILWSLKTHFIPGQQSGLQSCWHTFFFVISLARDNIIFFCEVHTSWQKRFVVLWWCSFLCAKLRLQKLLPALGRPRIFQRKSQYIAARRESQRKGKQQVTTDRPSIQ